MGAPNLGTAPRRYKAARLPTLMPRQYIEPVLDHFLILWLALLSVGRIDFLGGNGPFLLTPFLVISPILVASALWRAASEGWRLRIPAAAAQYLLWVSALLGLLLASTFLSYDLPSSGRRVSLLVVQVYLVFLIGMALANRPDPQRLLLKGAYAGLALCLLFSLAQVVIWITGPLGPEGFRNVVDLEPRQYLRVIPRLTGASHDANFGGFLVLFYTFLIVLLERPSPIRTSAIAVGLLLITLTLSRSAVLAALVLWAFMGLNRSKARVTARVTGALSAVLAGVTAMIVLSPEILDSAVRVAGLVGHRFSPEEGSTLQHAVVSARAWEVGTESVKNALLGIGYGNARFVLQDLFPGHEYGNFHSLFLTFFAESGTPAALLAIWIFGRTFVRAGVYRPLVAALITYNLFQQAHSEPTLWLIFLLAWVGIGPAPDRVEPPVQGMDRAGAPL